MGKPEIRPLATPIPLNRSSPKVAYVIMSWISTHMQIQSQSINAFLFPRLLEIARQKCLLGFFFRVLPTSHSRGPRTDFHAKYDKRRDSAHGCAFWGLENKNLTFKSPYYRQTAILGPKFDGTENRFTMGMLYVNSP